jgi:hypothetical protein
VRRTPNTECRFIPHSAFPLPHSFNSPFRPLTRLSLSKAQLLTFSPSYLLSFLPSVLLLPRAPRPALTIRNLISKTPVISHLSSVLCPLSSVICHLSSVICYLLSVLCPLSSVICPLSSVICHLSSVLCYLSSVLCHLSSVFITSITPGKNLTTDR